ncbi:hypothetical protein L202_00387 [Cryptococcus amylolentus CBS 6039]|uniref:Uncharacterized protein n=2 Tax=Cryptococcus amylolentus TaxID=104669 RepID=A0A1E3I792_9TREE|nr:hypothetical protein L202_00387 [Cryptococcus amylolentus CBS 6039]ODN84437.1 hypothetical protein L202_00387 [Cryptococcus amylolentus CBS 6039]ODO11759.1 hypothetical protein I350_00543 [Cryptococcus amylolentus CBS 6273]
MPSFNTVAKLLITTIILSSQAVYAADDRNCPDQWEDPANDICNPLRYIPNKALNCLAAALYFIVAGILTFWAVRRKANYFLCLPISCWFEGVGFVLRVVFRQDVHQLTVYIVANLFVILPPCAFLAADYILLGRLVVYLNAGHCIRPFNAKRVSTIFIISDVITFLIQASGGGLSASGSESSADLGSKLFLVGIAAQLVSFCLFTILYVMFGIRAYRDKSIWDTPNWKPLYFAMAPTCLFFIIRSVFRAVELSQGYIGYLATHEGYLLALDTLPLLLGVGIYCWFWPSRYIQFERNPFKNPGYVARGESSEGAEHAYSLRAYGSGQGEGEIYKPYGHQNSHFAASR